VEGSAWSGLLTLLAVAIWAVQEFWKVGFYIAVVLLLVRAIDRGVRHLRRRVTATLAATAKYTCPHDGLWMELEQRATAKDEPPPTLLELWDYNKTLNAMMISELTAKALLRHQAEAKAEQEGHEARLRDLGYEEAEEWRRERSRGNLLGLLARRTKADDLSE
jgi:hypothetical protein